MGQTRNLTIADGQVAATATEITAGSGDMAQRLNLTFCNTGSQDETLVLTISRNGGTARRLKRVVLATEEQLEITGLPLNSTDSLLGVTSNASVVDYIVSIAAAEAPLSMQVYDSLGGLKTAPYVLEQLDAIFS